MTRKECFLKIKEACNLYARRGLPAEQCWSEIKSALTEFEESILENK